MVKKILVSQPKPTTTKSPYLELEQKFGVDVDFRSLIAVERLTPREIRAQKVDILDHTAVVFNSKQAIDHFFSLCKDMRIKLPEDMKYFFVSQQVSLYVQQYVQYRKRKVFFGTTGKLPELVAVMIKHKAEKYLIPVSDVHDDHIKTLLDAKGLKYKEVVMYRTVSNDFKPGEKFDYDMMIFFTSAGVQALKKNFPDFKQDDIRIACYGNSAQKAVNELGLRLDLAAPTPEVPSITAALDKYLADNK